MTKTTVNLFVSYAHIDQVPCSDLLTRLKIQMMPSAQFDFHLWDDRAVMAGDPWRMEIMQAIDDADFGLLLISPAFLGSPFITTEELPRFIGNGSDAAIPVEVQSVNWSRHHTHGLQDHQVFRLDRVKPFCSCTGEHRNRFAKQLHEQIENRLERLGFKESQP